MDLPLFVYGTMRDEDVLAAVLGRVPAGVRTEAAWMPGFAAARVPGESYPYLVPADGARASGTLVRGLDDEGLDRIRFFEGEEYEPVQCTVERAEGPRVAAMCFAGVSIPGSSSVAWSLERWQAEEKPRFLAMTREFMALWHRAPAERAEALWRRLLRESGSVRDGR